MKKVFKNFSISILSLVLFTLCFGLSVNKVNALDLNTIKVSDSFVNYVTDSFINKEKVTVIDKQGVDITEMYFSYNSYYFEKQDFTSIKAFFDDNVDTICIDESVKNDFLRSPFVQQTVSKRYFKTVNKDQASGELEYYLSGSFVWDRATGKITSIGSASINITHNNFGAGWKKYVSSMSTSQSISSDKYYATFSGGFNLRVTYSYYGIKVYDIDLGRFTASTTAHPEG